MFSGSGLPTVGSVLQYTYALGGATYAEIVQRWRAYTTPTYLRWKDTWENAKKAKDFDKLKEPLAAGFIPQRGLQIELDVENSETNELDKLTPLDILISRNTHIADFANFELAERWLKDAKELKKDDNMKVELPAPHVAGDVRDENYLSHLLKDPHDLFIALHSDEFKSPTAFQAMTLLHLLPQLISSQSHSPTGQLVSKLLQTYLHPRYFLLRNDYEHGGCSPLHVAAKFYAANKQAHRHLFVSYVKQAAGVDFAKENYKGQLLELDKYEGDILPVTHYVASDPDAIGDLVDNYPGINLDTYAADGRTPFWVALEAKAIEAVNKLLDARANPFLLRTVDKENLKLIQVDPEKVFEKIKTILKADTRSAAAPKLLARIEAEWMQQYNYKLSSSVVIPGTMWSHTQTQPQAAPTAAQQKFVPR